MWARSGLRKKSIARHAQATTTEGGLSLNLLLKVIFTIQAAEADNLKSKTERFKRSGAGVA